MFKRGFLLCLCLPVLACQAMGDEALLPDSVDSPDSGGRIVAIGDVHGDFDQLVKVLRSTGLIDRRNQWSGANAHLVQLGDLPDRGPDTRKAMDLLMELEKSAAQAGGKVTVLIGNHEAMMMTNDLRYVHPGEYKAFKDKNSRARRKAYYRQSIDRIKEITPAEDLPVFDKAYRKAWEKRFPLGYVEHRLAWAPTGKYGAWVMGHNAIVKVGDTLFVHGGLSPEYAGMSLTEINTRVRTALLEGKGTDTIVEDELGPLWYRGWVRRDQNPDNQQALEQVLKQHNAKRMVIGHTPIAPVIVPRFNGKLLLADVGLSAHYGSGLAAVELQGDQITTIVDDERLPIPAPGTSMDEYFANAAELLPDDSKLQRYLSTIRRAANDEAGEARKSQPAN